MVFYDHVRIGACMGVLRPPCLSALKTSHEVGVWTFFWTPFWTPLLATSHFLAPLTWPGGLKKGSKNDLFLTVFGSFLDPFWAILARLKGPGSGKWPKGVILGGPKNRSKWVILDP